MFTNLEIGSHYTEEHHGSEWPHKYKDCALYNKIVTCQIEKEHKMFNGVHNHIKQKNQKPFQNIFKGLDNSDMLDFEQLKTHTFKNIFDVNKTDQTSIKKSLNYANFTNVNYDLLSKKSKPEVISQFDQTRKYSYAIDHNLPQNHTGHKHLKQLEVSKFYASQG